MTDTLLVKVTDCRYPVSEDVLCDVFAPVARAVQIQMLPNAPAGTAAAMVRFQNPGAATQAMQLNGRNIYSDCNRMELSNAVWEQQVAPQQPQQPQMLTAQQPQAQAPFMMQQPGGGVMMMQGGGAQSGAPQGGAPQGGASQGGLMGGGLMQQQQSQHPQMMGMPQHGMPHMPQHGMQHGMQPHGMQQGMAQQGMAQQGMAQQGMPGQNIAQQQQHGMPQQGQMPQVGLVNVVLPQAPQPQQMPPMQIHPGMPHGIQVPLTAMNQPMMGGRGLGGGRGFGGRGGDMGGHFRGGRNGGGRNGGGRSEHLRHQQVMNIIQQAQAQPGEESAASAAAALLTLLNTEGANALAGQRNGHGHATGATETPFVSIAFVPEGVPLQHLYTLCESYGSVHYIRRNFKKPQVVSVKMVTYADAQNLSLNLKRVPFFDVTISGKLISDYTERTAEPGDSGDPLDSECRAHNFSSARHRPAAARCKCPPSATVRVLNLAGRSDVDVRSFFETLSLVPTSVTAVGDENNSFLVEFGDVADGVKAVVMGSGQVCGEERSYIQFEPAATAPAPVASPPAAAAVSTEEPAVAPVSED